VADEGGGTVDGLKSFSQPRIRIRRGDGKTRNHIFYCTSSRYWFHVEVLHLGYVGGVLYEVTCMENV
jgi:hypothetical protein